MKNAKTYHLEKILGLIDEAIQNCKNYANSTDSDKFYCGVVSGILSSATVVIGGVIDEINLKKE